MNEPLDELYFTWLYSHVGSVKLKSPAKTHWSLLRQLYRKEFVWLIPNDDNRVEDGRDLRSEFLEEHDMNADPEWVGLGCSMFEMLIALSRGMAFEAEGRARDWFWHILKNLDLAKYTDAVYSPALVSHIDAVLDRVIWRNYKPDGHGGLFPLDHPAFDQTEVEIWYQLNAYLLERE